MALQDGTPDGFDEWLAAWSAPPPDLVNPFAIEMPEVAPPIVGSIPSQPLPPSPPPPPPQQIAPPVAAQPELPQPELPAPEQPPIPMPQVESVPLDPSVMQAAAVPAPPEFDPFSPETWAEPPAPELGPVGHLRTTVAPHEQSLSYEEYDALTPLQRAEYDFDQQQKLTDFTNQRLDEIRKTDAARQVEAEQDFLDSQARAREITESALADANALASEKPKKFTDSLGNVLSSLAGIFVSTLVSPHAGAQAVSIVQKRMDDFARAQIEEYNRKAGAVDRKLNIAARLRDAGYNEFQTRSIIRIAGLQRARDQLLSDVQNFDPRGTAARMKFQHIAQVEAQMAAGAREMEKQNLETDLKRSQAMKARLEVAEKMAKLRGVGAGGGAGTVKPGNLSTAEVKAMLGPDANVPVPERPGGYTPAQAKQVAELAKSTREVREFETEEDRKLGVRGPDGKLLVDADTKKPIRVRNEADAQDLTKQIGATDQAIRLMDEVITLRKKHGWSSDLLKSPEWRQMKANWAELILQKKNIETLGALSESDITLVTDALGAKDATGMQDPTAGILQARRNAVLRTQGALRQRGVAEESIPKYPSLADLDEAGRMPGDVDRLTVLGKGQTGKMGKVTASDEQKKLIETWASNLKSDDADLRATAQRDLENAAVNAMTPEVRELAGAALADVVLTPPAGTPEQLGVEGRAVARETVPPAPKKDDDDKPKKKLKTDSAGNPI